MIKFFWFPLAYCFELGCLQELGHRATSHHRFYMAFWYLENDSMYIFYSEHVAVEC